MRNITQTELAKKSNIDQSYVSILESDHRTKSPTLKIIESISKALNVCPFKLMECECECCKEVNSMD